MTLPKAPAAIQRLDLPQVECHEGQSIRALERELEKAPARQGPILDATYANTHRFPAPEYALDAFIKAASGDGMTYTPFVGDAGVRRQLEANIAEHLGLDASDSSSTILAPGTQGALFIALAAVLEPGDVVILPDPDYLSTERTLRYFGAEVVRVPVLFEDVDGRPTLDMQALEDAAQRKPKLFIFSHPNNPTGAIYSDETLQQIADLAIEHDFLVLADQLYTRLVYDDESFTHIANLEAMKERTITTLGPSKTESLSGYRLGVAVAPCALIDRMEDMQSITALRAPAYAQHLLTHWLAEDGEYVSQRIKEYQLIRDWTVDRLNESGLFSAERSWGSSYIFPKILVNATDQEIALALKTKAGVIVNPGYQFGERGAGHIRLCIAQDEAEWSEALDRLIEVVGSFR
ncbi:aminotransferase class I/II-fold pyridoxal phosphate-dependent enzyme [Arthrobacter sp. MW3 TE3886]|uniref:aminotransferase class I/II-fold pyridoxal phosphate-dependent enzyme n=1 Tax=Arthrobacter sp. MW3 TE3886 TaxID=3156254 RepID=UPI0035190286